MRRDAVNTAIAARSRAVDTHPTPDLWRFRARLGGAQIDVNSRVVRETRLVARLAVVTQAAWRRR